MLEDKRGRIVYPNHRGLGQAAMEKTEGTFKVNRKENAGLVQFSSPKSFQGKRLFHKMILLAFMEETETSLSFSSRIRFLYCHTLVARSRVR